MGINVGSGLPDGVDDSVGLASVGLALADGDVGQLVGAGALDTKVLVGAGQEPTAAPARAAGQHDPLSGAACGAAGRHTNTTTAAVTTAENTATGSRRSSLDMNTLLLLG